MKGKPSIWRLEKYRLCCFKLIGFHYHEIMKDMTSKKQEKLVLDLTQGDNFALGVTVKCFKYVWYFLGLSECQSIQKTIKFLQCPTVAFSLKCSSCSSSLFFMDLYAKWETTRKFKKDCAGIKNQPFFWCKFMLILDSLEVFSGCLKWPQFGISTALCLPWPQVSCPGDTEDIAKIQSEGADWSLRAICCILFECQNIPKLSKIVSSKNSSSKILSSKICFTKTLHKNRHLKWRHGGSWKRGGGQRCGWFGTASWSVVNSPRLKPTKVWRIYGFMGKLWEADLQIDVYSKWVVSTESNFGFESVAHQPHSSVGGIGQVKSDGSRV